MSDLFTEVLDRYRAMLADSAKRHDDHGNAALAAALRQGQGTLYDLQKRQQGKSPVVAFAGLTNSGKSTLLSAVFGAKVAPTGNRPWSSVPVEYRYGDGYSVSTEFSDSIGRDSQTFDDANGLSEYVARYATASTDSSASMLYARMPADILKDGLTIADTPGFGAAEAAGGDKHTAATLAYLPRADYVFWVVKSLQGVTAAEAAFYHAHLHGCCRDIVVNCYDEFSESDQRNFQSVNSKPLGVRIDWHFVDAKTALLGSIRKDADAARRSGLEVFLAGLRHLTCPDRMTKLRDEFVNFFADIKSYCSRSGMSDVLNESRRLGLQYFLERQDGLAGDEKIICDALYASITEGGAR